MAGCCESLQVEMPQGSLGQELMQWLLVMDPGLMARRALSCRSQAWTLMEGCCRSLQVEMPQGSLGQEPMEWLLVLDHELVVRRGLSCRSQVWTLMAGCCASLRVEMPQGSLGQEPMEWPLVMDLGLVAHCLRWGVWHESLAAGKVLSRRSQVWTLMEGCCRSLRVEVPQGSLGQEPMEWLLVTDPGLVAHCLRWGVWHESLAAGKVLSRRSQAWTLMEGCCRSLRMEMPQGSLGQERMEWLLVTDPGLVAHCLRWGAWHESLVAGKVLSRRSQVWTLMAGCCASLRVEMPQGSLGQELMQ